MKRVSSRQRLVSWDAFDATAQEEEEEHDSLSDFESSPTLDQQGIVSKNVASNFLMPSSPNSTDSLSSYTTAATDLSSTMTTTTTAVAVVSPYASLKRKRSSAAKLAQEPAAAAVIDDTLSTKEEKDANVPKPVVEAYGWELSYDNDDNDNKNDDQQTQEFASRQQPEDKQQCLSFLDLSDDVTLRILSFVGPKDVCKAVMPTCHKLHTLLQTTEADLLWKEYCQLQWPESSSGSSSSSSAQDTQYVCYLNLVNHQHHQQQQKQASGGGAGEYRLQTIPYATLTALSPSRYATAIDETLFAPCRWSRTLGRYRPRRSTSTTELRTVAVSRGNDEPARVAIQFTGEIGTGDRCIRSNHAWSTPLPWNPQQQHPDNHKEQGVSRHCGGPLTRLFHRHHHHNNNNSHHNSHQNHHHPFQQQPPPNQSLYLPHHYSLSASLPIRRHPPRLLERLRRGRSSTTEAQQQQFQSLSSPLQDSPLQWRPFVIPYAERLPDGTLVQNITPRLIQYYEVSILPKPNDAEATAATRPRVPARHDDDNDNDQDLMFRRHGNNTSECVAVGLSCVEFALHTRMPGWDHLSYGYHGDDGGVFYGTGHMLREYGPTFGVGDVVGCGVDYLRGNIFFTLNGRYLGVAWDGLAHSPHNDFYAREWFPTVGMDTHCLVQCNFGQDPFQFDLSKHVQQTQGTILEQSLVNPAVAAATAPAATTQSAHF